MKILLGALLVAFLVYGSDSKGGKGGGKGGGGGGGGRGGGRHISGTTARSHVTQSSYGTPRPGTIGGNSAGSPSAPAQPPLPVAHLPAGPHQQPGAPQNPNPIGWNLPNAAGQPKIYPTMSPGNNPGHPLAPAGNNNPSQTIVNINSNSQPPSPSIIPVPVILAVPSIGESNRYHHYQPPSNTAVNHTEIIINNYHNGAAVPSNSTTPQNITSTPIANSSFSQITVTTKITASKSSSNRLQHYAATTILLFILHAFINANINK